MPLQGDAFLSVNRGTNRHAASRHIHLPPLLAVREQLTFPDAGDGDGQCYRVRVKTMAAPPGTTAGSTSNTRPACWMLTVRPATMPTAAPKITSLA